MDSGNQDFQQTSAGRRQDHSETLHGLSSHLLQTGEHSGLGAETGAAQDTGPRSLTNKARLPSAQAALAQSPSPVFPLCGFAVPQRPSPRRMDGVFSPRRLPLRPTLCSTCLPSSPGGAAPSLQAPEEQLFRGGRAQRPEEKGVTSNFITVKQQSLQQTLQKPNALGEASGRPSKVPGRHVAALHLTSCGTGAFGKPPWCLKGDVTKGAQGREGALSVCT
ncbi:hypothetical protein CB1_001033047 [Camelus ferus]|nr:hypothetical protein CB1_001033047 [Camelus ferus]